jgi:hydrogenase maturation protease
MNVRVIGIGNVFMSDNGFGPYVVRVLEAFYELPAGVQLIDGGAPGADLSSHLAAADASIVIESSGCGAPGDIRVSRARQDEVDLHTADMAPWSDEAMFVNVVPEWSATGVTLSRPVRTAVAPVIALVVAELERLGQAPRLRAEPRQPDTWWERAEVVAAG